MTAPISEAELDALTFKIVREMDCSCPYMAGGPGEGAKLVGPECTRCATVRAIASLRSRCAAMEREGCVWTDDCDGYMETGCGRAVVWEGGEPVKDGLKFCGFCGGKLSHEPLYPAALQSEEGEGG